MVVSISKEFLFCPYSYLFVVHQGHAIATRMSKASGFAWLVFAPATTSTVAVTQEVPE